MNRIYFSVIIPSYENIILFEKALLSVLQQDYIYYEVIVVDDSASDQIKEYLYKINNDRIKYYKNVPPRGAVKNWNYGISLAEGDYVILLHHDESIIRKDYLRKCFECICKTDCEVLISNVFVGFNEEVKRCNQKSVWLKKIICSYLPDVLYLFNFIGPTATVSVKRKFIKNFDECLVLLVDVDWYIKIIKGRKLKFIEDGGIYSIFGHENQISMNIDREFVRKKDEMYLIGQRKYMGVAFWARWRLLILLGRQSLIKKIIWR